MQGTQSKKKLLLTLVFSGVFILSALIVVLVLSKINTPASDDKKNVSTVTAETLIKGLQEKQPEAIASLEFQPSAIEQFRISAQMPGADFAVAAPVSGIVVYAAKDEATKVDAGAVLREAKTYFEQYGLTESSPSAASASYSNTSVACQVQTQSEGKATVTYGCANASVVNEEYSKITNLLDTYNKTAGVTALTRSDISTAGQTARTSEAVSGSLLALTLKNGTEGAAGKVLLFGAIDNKWEFVADLSTGKSTGKANVSDENMTAIKDPKWNGVLGLLVGVQ